MTKLRMIGATAGALVLMFPLSASTATAAADGATRAAGRNWDTIGNIDGALHQACRVSIHKDTKWRVYNRLDARHGEARAEARMTVLHDGAATGEVWRSGWITPGHVSDVGSVVVPRRPGYEVRAFGADNAGGGHQEYEVTSLNHC